MSAQVSPSQTTENAILVRSAIAAFVLQAVLLTSIGWHNHWLSHPQKTTGLDTERFVEAQIFEMPEHEHLVSEQPQKTISKPEAVISKTVGQGRKAKPEEASAAAQPSNVTTSGPATGPSVVATHGPVPIYSPSPVIPAYLQSKDIQSSVVIEFFITAQGAVTPRLLSSSDNEELDALAITTVKKWQFRPAEDNHKPVDAKIRLRIVFEVH